MKKTRVYKKHIEDIKDDILGLAYIYKGTNRNNYNFVLKKESAKYFKTENVVFDKNKMTIREAIISDVNTYKLAKITNGFSFTFMEHNNEPIGDYEMEESEESGVYNLYLIE